MATTNRLSTLQIALDANAAAYRRAVQASVPGDCWDFVILTAANEKQAEGYRQELALRSRGVGPTGAFFPAIQKSIVVADPPGRRAGSGGATLGVLRQLVAQHGLTADSFAGLRILLIHSGGASQRLPAYSPLGKIFAPLPLLRPDGQVSTLFDHLYITLAGLPERLGPGMLVLAGDVFLLFDHRHVSAPAAGVTALSMRVDAELGRGHGVFVTSKTGRIEHTLQKAPVEQMRQLGATDDQNRVLIDTGLLFFDPPHTRILAELAGLRGSTKTAAAKLTAGLDQKSPAQLDLYDDITAALAGATSPKQYLSSGADPLVRRRLWSALHGTAFGVMQLDGEFLHLGTTRQFREAMVGQNSSPAAELFQQNVLAHSDWPLEPGRRVYHSALLDGPGGNGSIGPGSVIEHSILAGDCRIRAGSVVSQVLAVQEPIRLDENLLLFQVPVRDSAGRRLYAQVLCGVSDDFKGRFDQGTCQFLNHDIRQWLGRHRIAPGQLWSGIAAEQRTLWNARVFPATTHRDRAGSVMWIASDKPADRKTIHAWAKGPRYSMAMLLEQADPQGLIEHREVVAAHLQTSTALSAIAHDEDRPLDSLLGHYSTAAAYEASCSLLSRFAQQSPAHPQAALRQSRAMWCAAQLLQRPDHPEPAAARQGIEQAMRSAFERIAVASEMGAGADSVALEPVRRLQPNTLAEASAPVRLDLAGGWTDTPPYCYERGGHVVNVAIDLDDAPPVRATVRTTAHPRLILESHDLGQRLDMTRLDARVDVRDPFALHKVALSSIGLLDHKADVRRLMRRLGAGLVISTQCRVPKGSGLGTSSILAATLLAALHETMGRPASQAQLVQETLLLEQRLSTGGGWQDQVGGIIGGVKSTQTAAGIPQRPCIEQLALSEQQLEALEQRLVVYYSGQQRLARDILRRVMGRWLGREPAMLLLAEELKASAAALRSALLKGQWTAAAEQIGRYWRIKKDLYPGSTTPFIDVLMLEMRQHYVGAGLAGAGGGGFAYFLCKDPAQAKRLRKLLAERAAQPGSMGNLYQTRINRQGLSVSRRPAAI